MPIAVKQLPYEKCFKLALKFVSDSEVRPVLTDVYHDEQNRMIATDGLCLIVIDNAHEGMEGQNIDKKGSLIGGRYPNVDRIIPNQFKSRIEGVNIRDWINVHERALLSVKHKTYTTTRKVKGQEVKTEHKDPSCPVTLKLDNDVPHLCYDLLDTEKNSWSDNSEWLSAKEMRGTQFDISYNCKFMIKSLKTLRQLGYKECDIEFTSDRSPFKISVSDVTIVISPIMTKRKD